MRDGVAGHDRRGALGLGADHSRQARRPTSRMVLAKALPVGRDVAGVADREHQVIRRVAENVDDLERGRLLSLQAVWVDRVHQCHRVSAGEVPHDLERVIEAPFESHDLGAVHESLRELVHRSLAGGDDDDRP